ncbi:MAG TPA: SirB2 family protein [Burkholderiales bacterium]|jgi:uncharacterized membrane protein SirB2
MDYNALKAVHVGAVGVTLGLFLLRGAWMMAGSPLLRRRWVRIVPHVVDTVLLVSAIWLAIEVRQSPFRDGWLTAKILGLLLYVVLGSVALKRGRSKAMRAGAFAAALAVFAYIVAVARAKNALPWS